jgi:hypothetical protein
MNILDKLGNKPVPKTFQTVKIKIRKIGVVADFIKDEKPEDFLKRYGLPLMVQPKYEPSSPTKGGPREDGPKGDGLKEGGPNTIDVVDGPKGDELKEGGPIPPNDTVIIKKVAKPKVEGEAKPKVEGVAKPKVEGEIAKPKVIKRTRKNKNAPRYAAQIDNPNQYIQAIRNIQANNAPVSTLYLTNRKLFLQKIEIWFKTMGENNREKDGQDFGLLLHQKLVKEYLTLQTPYRGLLLYHGLGSGKTCTAIAVAEGLKQHKKIFVFIPASLETNFYSEIRKCGHFLYRRNQHWLFVSAIENEKVLEDLSLFLDLPKAWIKKNKGAWIMDIEREPNYRSLSETEQNEINEQIDQMIHRKYHQINYNASNLKKVLTDLSARGNPFDNSVVLIDEAHKLVSTIVNKINSKGKETTAVMMLYRMLLNASDVRIVLMTGTPQVNFPNEISVLFNILRGYIKTWEYNIKSALPSREQVLEMLVKGGNRIYDFVAVEQGKLRITRNPYGFVNQYSDGLRGGDRTRTRTRKNKQHHSKTRKQLGGANEFQHYRGVQFDPENKITDAQFEKNVATILKKNKVVVNGETSVVMNMALPEQTDSFITTFLDISQLNTPEFLPKREIVFKKRIIGLGSYFLPTDETALPRFVLSNAETKEVIHYELTPMSDYQFSIYAATRIEEHQAALKTRKRKALNKQTDGDGLFGNTYRIYSRCNCNYVFPLIDGKPGRPIPDKVEGEEVGEEVGEEEEEEDKWIDGEVVPEDGEKVIVPELKYKERIDVAMKYLEDHATEYLSMETLDTYSPKFKRILQNITEPNNHGLHLVYSQFRTLEGIGILRLILLANGFAELSVQKTPQGEWQVQLPENLDLPRFMLYTGTESAEEREVLRNIYNGDWEEFPESMKKTLKSISPNNNYGEIVKIIMITGASAEGINLRNTRFVHLMEPFWHYVRLQQVIGRARRYRSHVELPEADRTVKVFLYMATFSEQQIHQIQNEIGEGILTQSEASKQDPNLLFTSDQALFEISEIKLKISERLLKAIQETSIDCHIHAEDENTCFSLGNIVSQEFASKPSLEEDILDSQGEEVKTRIIKQFKGREFYYYADEANQPQFNVYSSRTMDKQIGVYDRDTKKYTAL